MSSQNYSNKESNQDPNEINTEEDDKFNILSIYKSTDEQAYPQDVELISPFISYKDCEVKKEIFELNSHEAHWSTDDYFRIIYFKLNEIKQFKDSNKPAEFRNIPIEFSETNRKMNLDVSFVFEEETLNLNLRFTHFLKDNRLVLNNKGDFSVKDSEDLVSHETPDETNSNFDINYAEESNKMNVEVITKMDQMRGGVIYKNKNNTSKEFDEERIQEVVSHELRDDIELKEQDVNIEINDINQINQIKPNCEIGIGFNYGEDRSNSSIANQYEIGNSILRGRAKKPLSNIKNGSETKIFKNSNEAKNNSNHTKDLNDEHNLRSLQTLELNSDLTDQENKLKDNKINNKSKSLKNNLASNKKSKKIIIDKESEFRDLGLNNFNMKDNKNYNNNKNQNNFELSLNNDKKALEENLVFEDDFCKKQNLFMQENENDPNTIDNLYSGEYNLNQKKVVCLNINSNSVENNLKRVTRGNRAKAKPELIDLTGESENSAKTVEIDGSSKSRETTNNNKNPFKISTDIKFSSKVNNKSDNILKESQANHNNDDRIPNKLKMSKNTMISSNNMMDQEILGSSEAEAETEKEFSSKNTNNIEKFKKDKNLISNGDSKKTNLASNENGNKIKNNHNQNNDESSASANFIFKHLEKYEINPLARNEEDTEEVSNTRYSLVIQEKKDFLNLISEEDIKFDLKINNWNHEKKNFVYVSGKKLNLKKHTSETFELAKYEDIIFENKDFYLIKLIFSSKKKAKPANKEFCGIQNEKNTCYLNSIFQILFNLKILRKQIFSILSNEGTPLFFMQQAFFEMQKLNRNDIKILSFIRAMEWDETIQNDFGEMFFIVFEMLSEFEKNEKGESLLHSLCTGVYRTHIKCREIKYESSKREPFLLLQLDITGCNHLIMCFEKFLSVERMTEDNKYELEDRSKHEAIKSLHLETLPPILFISLMRFEYKEQIYKKFDKVVYEEFIDLGHYIIQGGEKERKETDPIPQKGKPASHRYELFGVVVHDGNAEGGHYYSFFKERKSRSWVKFNDSKTSYASEIDVFEKNFGGKEKNIFVFENGDVSVEYNGNSRTAYILVYLQQEKIDEILADVSEADLNETLLEFLNNPSNTNTKNSFKNHKNTNNFYDLSANVLTDESDQKRQEIKPFFERKVNTRSSYRAHNTVSSTLNQIKAIEPKSTSNFTYDFIKNVTNDINMVGSGQDMFLGENTKHQKNKSKKNLTALEFNRGENNKNFSFTDKDSYHNVNRFAPGQDICREILKCNKINENESSNNYSVNKNLTLRDQKILGKMNINAQKNLKRKNLDDLPKASNAEKKMGIFLDDPQPNQQFENVQILLEIDKADEEPNLNNKNLNSNNSAEKENPACSTTNSFNKIKFDYKKNLPFNPSLTDGKKSDSFLSNSLSKDFIERKKRESDILKNYKLKLFTNNFKGNFLIEDLSFNSSDLSTCGSNFFEELFEKNIFKNPHLKETLDAFNIENLKLVVLSNMGICLEILNASNTTALKEAMNKFHSKEIFLAIYDFPSEFLGNNIENREDEIIVTVNFIDILKENKLEFNLHKDEKIRLPLIFYADRRNLTLDHLICLLLERINNSSSKFEELSLDNKIFFINNNEKDILVKKKYTSIMFDHINDLSLNRLKKNNILRVVCETEDYLL